VNDIQEAVVTTEWTYKCSACWPLRRLH